MKSVKSVRTKLYNLAKQEQIDFQTIITRYLHEVVLCRISKSKWKEHFFLKGGNLMYAMQGVSSRPTTDIDFLGKDISNDAKDLEKLFVEILKSKPNDIVSFDNSSIQSKVINEQNNYNGIRISVRANFDTIIQVIQIDIGFGDTIVPKPMQVDYPVLLTDSEVPVLWAYTPETVIAEKLQAIISLAQLNSRMKDFYDIYTLIQHQKLDNKVLKEAITQTFNQRNTALNFETVVFTEDFYNDANRLKMWKSFLKKIKVSEISFEEVIKSLKHKLNDISLSK